MLGVGANERDVIGLVFLQCNGREEEKKMTRPGPMGVFINFARGQRTCKSTHLSA